MKKFAMGVSLSCLSILMTACQTTPRQYNGMTGYQVENQGNNTATLTYTLAGRKDQTLDESKLQRACQKVLGNGQSYKLNILSINEIINPALGESENRMVQIGHSRASFGFSNTQSYSSTEDIATRQALENRPRTLSVVRYTCS